MSVTQSYADYVLDQLQRVLPVTSRKMFGGVGVYSNGRIFALLDDDTLFFKVNDSNRQRYLDAQMPPFMPGGMPSMGYYQVPPEVLEDASELGVWAREAIAVSQAAAARKDSGRAKKR